jgi:hypothetical protein
MRRHQVRTYAGRYNTSGIPRRAGRCHPGTAAMQNPRWPAAPSALYERGTIEREDA